MCWQIYISIRLGALPRAGMHWSWCGDTYKTGAHGIIWYLAQCSMLNGLYLVITHAVNGLLLVLCHGSTSSNSSNSVLKYRMQGLLQVNVILVNSSPYIWTYVSAEKPTSFSDVCKDLYHSLITFSHANTLYSNAASFLFGTFIEAWFRDGLQCNVCGGKPHTIYCN